MNQDLPALAYLAAGLVAGLLFVVVGLVIALRHPKSGKTSVGVRNGEFIIITGHVGIALAAIGLIVLVAAGAILYFYARRSEVRVDELRETSAKLSVELAKRGEGVAAQGLLVRQKAKGEMPSRWLLELERPLVVDGKEFQTVEIQPGERALTQLEGQKIDVQGVPISLTSSEGGATAVIIPNRVVKNE